MWFSILVEELHSLHYLSTNGLMENLSMFGPARLRDFLGNISLELCAQLTNDFLCLGMSNPPLLMHV